MKTKIRRRGFIRSAGIMGGLGLSGAPFGVGGNAAAQPAAGSPAQGGIEPNNINDQDKRPVNTGRCTLLRMNRLPYGIKIRKYGRRPHLEGPLDVERRGWVRAAWPSAFVKGFRMPASHWRGAA